MARAIVTIEPEAGAQQPTNGSGIVCRVIFLGSDVPGGVQFARVDAAFLDTDSLAQFAQTVVNNVVATAVALGLTVARTAVFLPSYVRGS
jgi:hypothetical protein